MFELTHGAIPRGSRVCHSCDNPPCCNPKHLWLRGARENIHDAVEQGRRAQEQVQPTGNFPCKGSAHGRAKLAEADVQIIRDPQNAHITNKALAERFHVSPGELSRIRSRKIWKHV
jgi:hypothetical protein